ncbi:MAG: hypothetical protein WAX14_07660 [Rhodococcus sp. (in: high G+C Gram-positive bacteria)]|uniref:hypothetical protein n=1 Tax=Rhodococcus sp. TaxID=1831 RepID=UPI003BB54C87
MRIVYRVAACAATVALSALVPANIASAAETIPFQIDPAPFGNPNGSFDAPSVRCVAIVGEHPGSVTITGGKDDRWGCLLMADVQWLNLSTGTSGTARLSDGLNGIPAAAVVPTGAGQVVVVVTSSAGGVITPGIGTFSVP